MTPEDFAILLAKAMKPEAAPAPEPAPVAEPVVKAVSLEDVQNILLKSFAEFGKAIDEKIEKATSFSREGVGRIGTVQPQDEREANPLKYLVKKAQDHNSLDQTDKELISELTLLALREGMREE